MATRSRSTRPAKLTAEQATVPTSAPLSDVEKHDLATASAATEPATGKDGETATRPQLTFHALSRELFEMLTANARGETISISREGLKIHAARKGSPLTPENFEQWFRKDPTAPENSVCFGNDQPGSDAFMSVVMYDDGNLKTDKQYVTEDNPEGIVWRGNFLSGPGGEGKLVPVFACGEHFQAVQKALSTNAKEKSGHDVYIPGQSYAQCVLRIQNIRNRNRTERVAETAEQDRLAAKLAGLGGGKSRKPLGNLGDRAWNRNSRRQGATE